LAFATLAAASVLVGSAASSGAATQGHQSTRSPGAGSLKAASAPSELTFGLPAEILGFDTLTMTDYPSELPMHLIGGTLTQLSYNEKQFLRGLASWTTSANGLTLTFHLRRGLRFSDGSPLTSADVVATFKWQLTAKVNVQSGAVSLIKSVTAPSASTVVFNLKSAYPALPSELAGPNFVVFPASGLAKGTSFFKDPISDGQYMLKSFNGATSAVLVRNPYYYGPRAAIATLHFVAISDPATRLDELDSNQIQMTYDLAPTVTSELRGAVKPMPIRYFGSLYMYMSDRKQPLSNVRVRKAISDAINRVQINDIAYEGENSPLCGFFPTTMTAHVDNIPCTPNLKAAKALLKGTQCQNGCTITTNVIDGIPVYESVAVVIQQDLKPLNINVKIQLLDTSIDTNQENDGTLQTEINGLVGTGNVPNEMLIYGLDGGGGIQSLFSGYNNPTMNAAITRSQTDAGAALNKDLATIESLFAQDLPYVPLVDFFSLGATRVSSSLATMGPDGLLEVTPS
jgi:ABC-type transport system substrate-binding protein